MVIICQCLDVANNEAQYNTSFATLLLVNKTADNFQPLIPGKAAHLYVKKGFNTPFYPLCLADCLPTLMALRLNKFCWTLLKPNKKL